MAAVLHRSHRRQVAAAAVSVAVLAGCAAATPQVQPGQSRADVLAALGTPTGTYELPQGATRLEYARGPFGKQTWMVDLDAGGRVVGARQVLTEADFAQVVPGMSAGDLLRRLGRPSHRRGGGWQGGEVWSWRYDATFCQWFQASVVDARVRDAAYGPDPLCDIDDHDFPDR